MQELNRPLTFMAERAILRNKYRRTNFDSAALVIDMDVEGYRDYRGVPVFGAWLWDMNLDVGVAVEIDVEEAMSNSRIRSQYSFCCLGAYAHALNGCHHTCAGVGTAYQQATRQCQRYT